MGRCYVQYVNRFYKWRSGGTSVEKQADQRAVLEG